MPILDFKEIPEAHISTGLQDTFELFAREFLDFIGYTIITDPDRGADGGVDLIVEEKRTGVGGETVIRWMVSCKHKAHSGRSVSPTDESNIRDRVDSNHCQGFMGFYSTLASTGLSTNLQGMSSNLEYQVFDHQKIESKLLHSAKGLEIVERYFPESFSSWKTEFPEPAKIFMDTPSLKCKVCDKQLLEQEDKGVITIWQQIRKDYENEPQHFHHIFWTCRGRCDDILVNHIRSQTNNLMDGWEDIADVMMPTIFIKWVMSIMNEQKSGCIYSDEAFENLKHFMLQVFPFVSRQLTSKEKERIKSLSMFPAYLGGLDYGE